MKKECPNCHALLSKDEIIFVPPALKENPKWYEASHRNPEWKCPNCKAYLKPNIKSFWPAVFVLLGIIPVVYLSSPYGEICAFAIAGISALLAGVNMKYEVRDL